MKSVPIVYARQNTGVEKELPHLDDLDQGLSLWVSRSLFVRHLEDVRQSLLEYADIAPLDVFENAVEDVDVGKSVPCLRLNSQQWLG